MKGEEFLFILLFLKINWFLLYIVKGWWSNLIYMRDLSLTDILLTDPEFLLIRPLDHLAQYTFCTQGLYL